jgi:hypothetical protein
MVIAAAAPVDCGCAPCVALICPNAVGIAVLSSAAVATASEILDTYSSFSKLIDTGTGGVLREFLTADRFTKRDFSMRQPFYL